MLPSHSKKSKHLFSMDTLMYPFNNSYSLTFFHFVVYLYSSIVGSCMLNFVAPIMDLIFPLNETRSHIHIVELDYYFFAQDDHFIFSSIHTLISCTWCMSNLVSCDLLVYTLAQHACGIFRILR